jgi:ABC-type antimicrobial peptide transport system permease subunit
LRTLDRVVDQNLSVQNALAALSVVFAALAITLALIGLYGVVSYSVVRRTREFGIRMAVGAKRRDVIGLVLRDTAVTVTVSVLVALPCVLLGGRWVESLLYGVKPGDPVLCLAAVLIIVASALSAAAFPAQQAAAVDPQSALRAE